MWRYTRHWRYILSGGVPDEPTSDWAVIDGANIDDAATFVAEKLEPDDGTWIYFREVDSPYTFRVQVCRVIRWQVGKYEKVEMKLETKETKMKLDANQITKTIAETIATEDQLPAGALNHRPAQSMKCQYCGTEDKHLGIVGVSDCRDILKAKLAKCEKGRASAMFAEHALAEKLIEQEHKADMWKAACDAMVKREHENIMKIRAEIDTVDRQRAEALRKTLEQIDECSAYDTAHDLRDIARARLAADDAARKGSGK
jgi:hypothetical protein